MKTLQMDPRLMGMIGKKLYQTHPLPILVRELLQNAIFACVRKGTKEPKIVITISRDPGITTISCQDNGVGMTTQQLYDDFLCLGNTSSHDDSRAVGGFGVAKAALMRNARWSCHTLDHKVDETYFTDEGEIVPAEYLDGTLITAHITEPTFSEDIIYALEMIYLSDVDVTIRIESEAIYDEHAGFHNELAPMAAEMGWSILGTPGVSFGDHEVIANNYYRIGGLVQFRQHSYAKRKTNFIIDIETCERPASDNYPFNMSREGLINPWSWQIHSQLASFDAQPKTTDAMAEENMPSWKPPVNHFVGTKLRGRRNYPRNGPGELEILYELLGGRATTAAAKHDDMYFEGYNKDERDLRADSKVLRLWRELLCLVCSYKDEFGIGFIVDPKADAVRLYAQNGFFYLINPDAGFSLADEAKTLLFYFIAVHEAAHFVEESHNDDHAVEMNAIIRSTCDEFMAKMTEFTKILS
jgi:hypothetical protein